MWRCHLWGFLLRLTKSSGRRRCPEGHGQWSLAGRWPCPGARALSWGLRRKHPLGVGHQDPGRRCCQSHQIIFQEAPKSKGVPGRFLLPDVSPQLPAPPGPEEEAAQGPSQKLQSLTSVSASLWGVVSFEKMGQPSSLVFPGPLEVTSAPRACAVEGLEPSVAPRPHGQREVACPGAAGTLQSICCCPLVAVCQVGALVSLILGFQGSC